MGDVKRWQVVTAEGDDGERDTHDALVSYDERADRWTVETDDGSTTIEAPHARGAIMLAFEGMSVAEIVAPGDRTCAEAMTDARKAAARRGVLDGYELAMRHAVPVIDGATGKPAIDWTDAVVALGDAATGAPRAAPTAPSIGDVRVAAVSAFATWLRRHKTHAGPWTLAKEAEEEGAAVIGELIEAALAAPRGR